MTSSPTAGVDPRIVALLALNLKSVDRTRGHARRGQHAKHHGCVSAILHVRDDVPPAFRVGVFARPAAHDALVRFSNGRAVDDRKADAHGMAIKLPDVAGLGTAQDFVLVDHETFFTGEPREYALVTQATLARSIWLRAFAWLRLLCRPRLLLRIRLFVGKRPRSPLTCPYFSGVPYRLGEAAVKYVAVPRDTPRAELAEGPDMLAEALSSALSAECASFDLGVDVQHDTGSQPIEDPTINWREAGADRVWLARLVIPRQRVNATAPLAENLAFSPWHSLPEHEPLGYINRARGPVYAAMSASRHRLNGVEPEAAAGAPAGYGERPAALGGPS